MVPRSCEICRAAHAKCDNKEPSCGRCLLLRRECIKGLSYPFRYSNSPTEKPGDGEFDFSHDQEWVPISSNVVEFVYEELSTIEEQCAELYTPTAESPPGPFEITTSDRAAPGERPPKFPSTLPSGLTPVGYLWQSERRNGSLQEEQRVVLTESPHSGSFSSQIPRLIPESPETISTARQWSLNNQKEALLLRHFVTQLSLWFDYCDPQNSFATSVVQRAITSPPLLYAILATSARHLSVTSGYDASAADRYHRECLALLIPILDDSSAALDEGLYAATVILRLFEEISVPLVGKDTQSHFLGTHTFVRAQDLEYHQPSGIRQAAFRVVLRQEIVVAFRAQRPVKLLREYVQVDRSMDRMDDWTLAFHIIVLCAEVLTYCYGDDAKTPEAWDELAGRAQSWMESKSASFEPLYRVTGRMSETQIFPEIWLLNDCHVAAYQHYLMCQILLVAHDPRRPQLGPGRAEAVDITNRIVRNHVRDVCGIALSNSHCIPSMFTACIVIAMCGDLFMDYDEQKVILDILVKTDVDLAWPTASVQTYLRQQWGWDQSE